jgi:hypothetical protein
MKRNFHHSHCTTQIRGIAQRDHNNGRPPEPHSGVDRRLKFDQCSMSMRSDIRETHYTELIHGSIIEIILNKLTLDPVSRQLGCRL